MIRRINNATSASSRCAPGYNKDACLYFETTSYSKLAGTVYVFA